MIGWEEASMANKHIATYLNDHLAGSVVAIELWSTWKRRMQGLMWSLRRGAAAVSADRRELEALMQSLQVTESRTRKVSAWLSEKMTELKLRLDDPGDGALRLLEALEAVSLGIEGKLGLWRALAVASEGALRCKSSTMSAWRNAR